MYLIDTQSKNLNNNKKLAQARMIDHQLCARFNRVLGSSNSFLFSSNYSAILHAKFTIIMRTV